MNSLLKKYGKPAGGLTLLLTFLAVISALGRPLVDPFWAWLGDHATLGLSFFIVFGLVTLFTAKENLGNKQYTTMQMGECGFLLMVALTGAKSAGDFRQSKFDAISDWLTQTLHIIPFQVVSFLVHTATVAAAIGILAGAAYVVVGIVTLTLRPSKR